MNYIALIGNIGTDLVLKEAGATKVLNFTLATSRRVKKGDSYEKETDWHTCVVFGTSAETIEKYCNKGTKLAVQGEMTYQSWEDKEGKKQTRAQVKVQSFEFLEKAEAKANVPLYKKDDPDHFNTAELPF